MKLIIILLALSILLIPVMASAQSGGQFAIKKSVIAGGGGRSLGGTFTSDGTIGQPVAGENNGGSFRLNSGFWAGGQPVAGNNRTPFDYDADVRADLSVWRQSDGNWYVLRGTAGYMVMTFGVPGDLL
ncbi:MAG: hypothetical protein WBD27_10560, partial [Pyrinomonadaceae bacterium]